MNIEITEEHHKRHAVAAIVLTTFGLVCMLLTHYFFQAQILSLLVVCYIILSYVTGLFFFGAAITLANSTTQV